MYLPAPPLVDFATAYEQNWHRDSSIREKTVWHLGVIVSKTGHDRGQKEMYLYSPTVKRHDGKIVCSNDFLNFEVGDWVIFNVLIHTTHHEVYIGGKKWPDPFTTRIKFDSPIVEVRACMYPVDQYSAISCRQQTQRCWSPDLGDLFIDAQLLRSAQLPYVAQFQNDREKLYYVTASYHKASIFNDFYGDADDARLVYWRIEHIREPVNDDAGVADWSLCPWRRDVKKYLDEKKERKSESENDASWNVVPPWYIRSSRVLTNDMICTWEEEAKRNQSRSQTRKWWGIPVIFKNGVQLDKHPQELFNILKEEWNKMEEKTKANFTDDSLRSKYSWKKVMSYDGEMLEPGSQLPPVSNRNKKKKNMDYGEDERMELVQDSAGLFMNSAAARSYVEIKESGCDKVWITGGWKNPGEAWDSEATKKKWDRPIHAVDDIPLKQETGMIKCRTDRVPERSRNLLGAKAKAAPKPKIADSTEPQTLSQESKSSSTSSLASTIPPVPRYSFASASKIAMEKGEVKKDSYSFASASKMTKEKEKEEKKEGGEKKANGERFVHHDNDELNQLREKYDRLAEYVRMRKIEANKPSAVKGFNPLQYIRAMRGQISMLEAAVKSGVSELTVAEAQIDDCYEKIATVKECMRSKITLPGEMMDIHLTKEDDADMKVDLKAHVEIQKNRLEEMRWKIKEMEKR